MRRAIFFFTLLAAAAVLASGAPVTYDIRLDTSPFAGTGLLSLQFNPAGPLSDPATVTLNWLSSLALLSGAPVLMGGASGDLIGGTAAIANSDPVVNLYEQTVALGGLLSFEATFDGQAVNSPSDQGYGSTFYVSVLDPSTFATLLGGGAIRVEIFSDGSTQLFTPEPGSLGLLGVGLAALAMLRRLSA